ncbi:MAG TPA: anhydro-N-acetylmuramic acid kinase [Terriglobia bacterium]|nr:anhydro-N-acetylmuramic acid kinase [Terriglobia bacterium]
MKTGRYAVGLMSGTSMDGIDAALVQIRGKPERPRVQLEAFGAFPYPAVTHEALLDVASGKPATAGEISKLNYQVGELFARAALAICRRGRIETTRLYVIGSHGQTIFHQGPKGKRGSRGYPASTLQIGEPAVIAERTRAAVVADFRAADLAAGGQGAPLVPVVDYLLLRDRRRGSIALNLGGIANITAIPANADMDEVFGFDTGPANMVIDGLAAHLTRGRMNYDTGGKWASRGKVIESLLAKMLREPFFACSPPKSAGREQFGDDFLTAHFLSQKKTRPENLIRTATELTARSVAQAINQFVLPRGSFHRLIISGGGAHNLFLLERLRALLPSLTFHSSTDFGLPVDAKEAIAFALLADRTLHGLPGNLPAVTGARRFVVLGKIVRP